MIRHNTDGIKCRNAPACFAGAHSWPSYTVLRPRVIDILLGDLSGDMSL